jgi:glutamate synthase domain-containing protein 2
MAGLDPTSKSARLANYIMMLRKEILQLSHACGVRHPSEVSTDSFEILDECFEARSATECFRYPPSRDR